MKTIEELCKEINASEELQKAVSEIKDKTSLTDFLKKHGCDASAEEFAKFVKSQSEGEIGDDSAETAAGGRGGFLDAPWGPYWDQFRRPAND